eukprot:Blabericola_migrator_1__6799@NODE_343_length_9585_cov_71_071023_g276_i0_p1_GENE_NODE_343_length_9585_cov_71_071023_g276_i0NODE_343_length_9585_cov_71_071023_g276_i0_p1_ORF_typecomplete_len1622_score287_88RIC1/PF07064_13/2_2e05_NODE_343_length_9585_cov_71_071023_g276_i0274892
MYPIYVGRPGLRPNVGSCDQPIVQLLESQDRKYVLCVTASTVVVLLNDTRYFRPVARWGRTPEINSFFGGLTTCCWTPDSGSVFGLSLDGFHVRMFDLKTTAGVAVSSSPVKKGNGVTKGDKKLPAAKGFKFFTNLLASPHSPTNEGTFEGGQTPKTDHKEVTLVKLSGVQESFTTLKRQPQLPRRISQMSMFSLPLKIRSLYVPLVPQWTDLAQPLLCALRQQPGFILMDIAPEGKGVKSIFFLTNLCFRRSASPSQAGSPAATYVSLRHCWRNPGCTAEGSGRWPSLYIPDGAQQKHSSFLGLLHGPLDKKTARADWAKAQREPDDKNVAGGIICVQISTVLNVMLVCLNTEWAFLLRYHPGKSKSEGHVSPSQTGEPNPQELFDRPKIGRCVCAGVNGIIAGAFLETRWEVAFLRLDGLVEIFSLDNWFNSVPVPLHRWYTGTKIPQALVSGPPSFTWNYRGTAVAISNGCRSLEVFSRSGISLVDTGELHLFEQTDYLSPSHGCIPAVWAMDDSTLLIGLRTEILTLDFLSKLSVSIDGGLSCPWSNIDVFRLRNEMYLAIESDEDPLRPVLRNELLPKAVSYKSIHVCAETRLALLHTDQEILLGSFSLGEARWGTVWQTASLEKSMCGLFKKFPLDPTGPIGWYTCNMMFYTATHVPANSSHVMYILVLATVMEVPPQDSQKPDVKYQISFAACSAPFATKPLRVFALDWGHKWRAPEESNGAALVLQQLCAPVTSPVFSVMTASGITSFEHPPLGVFFTDSTLVCYRPHRPDPSCRSSHSCPKPPEDWTGPVTMCLQTLYVAHTKLVRPLEIRFIIDIFTFLIRDNQSRLFLGHLCMSEPFANHPLRPKPISLMSPRLVLSRPLLDEMVDSPRVPVSASRPGSPFSPVICRPIHEFEYFFQTRGSIINSGFALQGSAPPLLPRSDEIAPSDDAISSSDDAEQITPQPTLSKKHGSANTFSPCIQTKARSEGVPAVGESKSFETVKVHFPTRSAWNYVSSAMAGREQASVSSSSVTIPTSADFSDCNSAEHPPLALWGDETMVGSKGDTRTLPQSLTQGDSTHRSGWSQRSQRSERRPSEVLRIVQDALSTWVEECTQLDPLERALFGAGRPVDNFAWGGVELMVSTPTQLCLLVVSTSIYPFSPSSPIACRKANFFERKQTYSNGSRRDVLHHQVPPSSDCLPTGTEMWTQQFSARVVPLHKVDGIVIAASKPLNALFTFSTKALSYTTPGGALFGRRSSQIDASPLSHWTQFLVENHPLNVRLLLQQLTEPLFHWGSKSPSAIWGCNVTSVNLFRSIEELVYLCLSKCFSAIRVQDLIKEHSVPSVSSIQRLLERSAALPEVMVLRYLLSHLKRWPQQYFRIMTRVSRIHEPLISPFLLFSLAGETIEGAFDQQIKAKELRTAMALLVPLQQVVGPIALRKGYLLDLLYHACLEADIPLIVDLLSFNSQHTFSADNLWAYQADSGVDGVVLRALETLLNDFQWRRLMLLVVKLRLDLADWFCYLQTSKKKWQGHSTLNPADVNKMVDTLRDAFWIFHRRVTLIDHPALLSSSKTVQGATLRASSRMSFKQEEFWLTDWMIHLLFYASIRSRLRVLSSALMLATSDACIALFNV